MKLLHQNNFLRNCHIFALILLVEVVFYFALTLIRLDFCKQFSRLKYNNNLKNQLIVTFEKHADCIILNLKVLIKNAFKLWKGTNEQTDDVLVIGIESFSINNSNWA